MTSRNGEFELEGEFEGEGEFELEGEFEGEGEFEFEGEGEGEFEGEEFLGTLGRIAGGLFGGQGEGEFEGEFEGEEFFRRIARGVGGFVRRYAPMLRSVARVAAPLVGTAVGGPLGGMIGRAAGSLLEGEVELEGEFEFEGEGEFEFEGEFEGELESPLSRTQAAAEFMAAVAARAQSEAEAEAMAGAATVASINSRDLAALRRVLPNIVEGTAVLTTSMRRGSADHAPHSRASYGPTDPNSVEPPKCLRGSSSAQCPRHTLGVAHQRPAFQAQQYSACTPAPRTSASARRADFGVSGKNRTRRGHRSSRRVTCSLPARAAVRRTEYEYTDA